MGIDLAKHRPVAKAPRTFVPQVDLSRFAGYQATVSQLAALMAEPCRRGVARPLVQFIKDWNYWADSRCEMLDGPPPAGADAFHAAAIAAVVHALTERDEVDVPAWVHERRAEPERLISGHSTTTDSARLVMAAAPATCSQHGVYFEAGLLERGRSMPSVSATSPRDALYVDPTGHPSQRQRHGSKGRSLSLFGRRLVVGYAVHGSSMFG